MLHASAQAVWLQFWAHAADCAFGCNKSACWSVKAEMTSGMLASVYNCVPALHSRQAAGDTSQRTWACAEASAPCEESSAAAENLYVTV